MGDELPEGRGVTDPPSEADLRRIAGEPRGEPYVTPGPYVLPEVARSEPGRWSAEVVRNDLRFFNGNRWALYLDVPPDGMADAESLAAQVNASPSVDVTGLRAQRDEAIAVIQHLLAGRPVEKAAAALVAAVQVEAPETPREPPAIDAAQLLADLYDHADGNVGDGCWALHDKYAAIIGRVTTCSSCGNAGEGSIGSECPECGVVLTLPPAPPVPLDGDEATEPKS